MREQLLAPGAAEKDLLLGHVRAWLGEPSRPARRATKLLLRLAAGGKTAQPADAAVWERLWLSGTVRVDSERKLRIRNRIVKELVAARWLKQRGSASALAGRRRRAARGTRGGRLLVHATPTRRRHRDLDERDRRARPPSKTLTAACGVCRASRSVPTSCGSKRSAARAAPRRRSLQPWRRTRGSASCRAKTRPRIVLLSEFWLRRAREQAHAEQREPAILLAQRAAALPAATPGAAAYLAELAGDDYAQSRAFVALGGRAASTGTCRSHKRRSSRSTRSSKRLRTPFGAAAGAGALGAAPLAANGARAQCSDARAGD